MVQQPSVETGDESTGQEFQEIRDGTSAIVVLGKQ